MNRARRIAGAVGIDDIEYGIDTGREYLLEVDIAKLQPGELLIVEWRKKPVWIVNRTDQNLADLASLEAKLTDVTSDGSKQPEYAKNGYR